MKFLKRIRAWWRGLFRKRRFSMLNATDNSEEWHIHLSPASVFAGLVAFVLLLFILTLSLVAYSPVLEFLPGYRTEADRSRESLLQNIIRLDSMERMMNDMMTYNRNIALIMEGRTPVARTLAASDSSRISKVLVSEEQLRARVAEMGAQLSEDYEGKNVILVCILKGAVHFFSDLSRHMTCHMEMDFMSISSYGNGRKTSGIVRIAKDMDADITGRHVLIVEDIMDSGLTLNYLTTILRERKPASLKIACLLDKPSRREVPFQPDFCGAEVPDEFVVGYGLDYNETYRNLPFVGVLRRAVYSDIV